MMRKLHYLLIGFGCYYTSLFSQELPALKVGDELNYLLENGTQSVNFDITLTEVTNGIGFTWTMSAPANKTGSIKISANALKTTTKYLSGIKAEDKALEDQSFLFISDVNYNDLVKSNKTTMDLGEENTGVWSGNVDEIIVTYKRNTGYYKAHFIKLENSAKEMVVLPVGPHHIIAKWSLRSKLTLISIK